MEDLGAGAEELEGSEELEEELVLTLVEVVLGAESEDRVVFAVEE